MKNPGKIFCALAISLCSTAVTFAQTVNPPGNPTSPDRANTVVPGQNINPPQPSPQIPTAPAPDNRIMLQSQTDSMISKGKTPAPNGTIQYNRVLTDSSRVSRPRIQNGNAPVNPVDTRWDSLK